jgi:hypothetical protein
LHFSTWRALYESDLQGLYAVLVVPALFLVYRLWRGRPRGARFDSASAVAFVDAVAIAFAVETIADAWGMPLVRALSLSDSAVATAVLVFFVLLGDFRVYLLIFGLVAICAGQRWVAGAARAIGWTMVVPVAAYALNALLRAAIAGLHPDSIWLVYELLFTGVALALRRRLLQRDLQRADPALRGYVAAVMLYSAVYYGLWALSDLLIQVADRDVGWLLRIVPNQLYYAFWTPFVFFSFFSRRYAATSASTQAAR